MRRTRVLPLVLLTAILVLPGMGCKKRTVRVEPNEIPRPETTTPTPPPPGTPPTPGDTPAPTSPTTPPKSRSISTNPRLRVIHAAVRAPAVDIHLGETAAIRKLSYKTASSYTELPDGSVSARVTPTGTDRTVLGPTDMAVAPGGQYTLAALGSAADGTLKVVLLTDDRTPPASGKARVRLVHGAPDAPAVDIAINSRVAVSNLRFGTASGAYVELPAATHQIKVSSLGSKSTLLGPLPLTVRAGKIYTLVTMGKAADKTLNLQVYRDN